MPKKFYCGSKVYDTSRAERVLEYGTEKMQITLYKSNSCDKPEWFYVCREGKRCEARQIDEKYVRNIFINRERLDLCEKHKLN